MSADDVFRQGLEEFKAQDYKASERLMQEALDAIDEHHELYNKYASSLGLAQVLNTNRNGLIMCRDAASNEVVDGDVFLNLAMAEWHSHNRRRSINVLFRGLKIDKEHEGLNRVCDRLDGRRSNAIPFLDRTHIINRALGRLKRRHKEDMTVHGLLY